LARLEDGRIVAKQTFAGAVPAALAFVGGKLAVATPGAIALHDERTLGLIDERPLVGGANACVLLAHGGRLLLGSDVGFVRTLTADAQEGDSFIAAGAAVVGMGVLGKRLFVATQHELRAYELDHPNDWPKTLATKEALTCVAAGRQLFAGSDAGVRVGGNDG